MGNCVGGFKKYTRKRNTFFRKKRKICLCIIGMDSVGKSTVIKALAAEDINEVLPTNGFSFYEISYKSTKIVFYDLGGDDRIRAIWSNYYPEVFGVIYMVDGTDSARIEENKELLAGVLGNDDLSMKPLLLLINKKDRGGCVDEIELSDRLALHDLAERHNAQIRVEVCSAIHGTGKAIDSSITDGLDWLLDRIYEDYSSLSKRVNEAMERLKVKQQEDRSSRQQRVETKTFEATSEAEKLKFAEQLAHGTRQRELANPVQAVQPIQNGNVPSAENHVEKPVIERKKPFHKFVKPRVVPLQEDEGHTNLAYQRSASDSALDKKSENESTVFQKTLLPTYLPPMQQASIKHKASSGAIQARLRTAQATSGRSSTKNQIIPLTVLSSAEATSSKSH